MKTLGRYFAAPALLMLMSLSGASQAFVVSDGFETGAGIFDSSSQVGSFGEFVLAGGSYSLDLSAFSIDPSFAGAIGFGIANVANPSMENYQVSIADTSLDNFLQTFFTTAGGKFNFLVFGNAGSSGTGYEASINAVPLPPALWMLGSALVGLVTVGRRKFGA